MVTFHNFINDYIIIWEVRTLLYKKHNFPPQKKPTCHIKRQYSSLLKFVILLKSQILWIGQVDFGFPSQVTISLVFYTEDRIVLIFFFFFLISDDDNWQGYIILPIIVITSTKLQNILYKWNHFNPWQPNFIISLQWNLFFTNIYVYIYIYISASINCSHIRKNKAKPPIHIPILPNFFYLNLVL